MKKVMTLLLVAVMVFAMATTAFAAKAGDTVTVAFSTSNNPGFISFNASLNYDSSALEVVSVKAGSLINNKGTFSDGAKPSFMAMEEVTGNGELFVVTFKVLDGAKEGETYNVTASIDEGSALNGAYETVTFGVNGGSVTIDGHEHVWGEWEVTKEATCGEAGEKTRTCSACGEVETKEIPATGEHTWGKWTVTKEATCQEKGEKTRECSVCGEVETKTIKKADHKYKDGKCVWCGKKKPSSNKDDVPATGDITGVVSMGVVAMISVVAAAAYVTKRRITK